MLSEYSIVVIRMNHLLCIIFSFYASLDAIILSESFSLKLKDCFKISIITSFITCSGMKAGQLLSPFFNHYTPDEITTIALLFLILYYLDLKVTKFTVLASLIHQRQTSSSVIAVLLSINNLGFGFLAGIQLLSIFWMMLFTFLFSCMLLKKKTMTCFTHKSWSIFIIALMIFLIHLR